MKIQVNGKTSDIQSGLALSGLLEQMQLNPQRVVVERNREIVRREKYSDTLLHEGDTLEILHFVGGG